MIVKKYNDCIITIDGLTDSSNQIIAPAVSGDAFIRYEIKVANLCEEYSNTRKLCNSNNVVLTKTCNSTYSANLNFTSDVPITVTSVNITYNSSVLSSSTTFPQSIAVGSDETLTMYDPIGIVIDYTDSCGNLWKYTGSLTTQGAGAEECADLAVIGGRALIAYSYEFDFNSDGEIIINDDFLSPSGSFYDGVYQVNVSNHYIDDGVTRVSYETDYVLRDCLLKCNVYNTANEFIKNEKYTEAIELAKAYSILENSVTCSNPDSCYAFRYVNHLLAENGEGCNC